MTFGTMERIQTVTVPAGGQAAIEFTNIPQTYDDLVIRVSIRNNNTGLRVRLNSDANANYSWRRLNGNGTAAFSDSNATYGSPYNTFLYFSMQNSTTDTASTFSNGEMYLPNYRSSSAKSAQLDSVAENNATSAFMAMQAGLWTGTAAVTSITLSPDVSSSPSIAQHSTATLYGITRVPAGAKATGGVITDTDTHWIHTFTSSGTFTPLQNITVDYLVVAGGGSGGFSSPGGGGAGGLRCTVGATGGGGSLESPLSLTAQNYTVTVGAGGAGGVNTAADGSNSVFSTITSTGGGRGAGNGSGTPAGNGGSGGGATETSTTNWGTGIAGQGYRGGNNNGGGGGAGAAGATGYGAGGTQSGAGGDGVATTISGSSITYAGGGAGYSRISGGGALSASGGAGGGGNTTANGTANRGGGGGADGGSGGSGIVIVRYAK